MKKLTESALIKEGWIKAKRQSGKIDWLWNEHGQIYTFDFDKACEVMRKAYPGVYA